jgi:uncharacterized membrane protein YsdA (DUF1294 family)/cold shock CspA family protein
MGSRVRVDFGVDFDCLVSIPFILQLSPSDMEKKRLLIPNPKKNDNPVVRTGKIVAWDQKRGFGWLECEGERLFVHLREFKGTKIIPGLNVEFPFVVGTDVQGRPCAKGVDASLVNGSVKVLGWLQLATLLFWPIAGVSNLSELWWIPASQMMIISIATYKLYEYDKRQAIAYGWRVPQTIMYLAEMAGGWPGAFIAQRRLRHKSTKKSYQSIFWGIILLYQVVGIDQVFDNMFTRDLWKAMGESRISEKL